MKLVSLLGSLTFYILHYIDIVFGKGNNKFDYFTLGLLLNIYYMYVRRIRHDSKLLCYMYIWSIILKRVKHFIVYTMTIQDIN